MCSGRQHPKPNLQAFSFTQTINKKEIDEKTMETLYRPRVGFQYLV